MRTPGPSPLGAARTTEFWTHKPAAAIPIHGLHHSAWRCRDAEQTRHFYEDLLGLPLWHILQSDHAPSTGEYCPHAQLFFRMSDGSCLGFFDLSDDQAAAPLPNTPAWVAQLALRVDTVEHIARIQKTLEESGVEVLGPIDHHIFQSIYFFDPNGIALELTAQLASEMQMLEESRHVHERLTEWMVRKEQGRPDGAAGAAPPRVTPWRDDRSALATRGAADAAPDSQ